MPHDEKCCRGIDSPVQDNSICSRRSAPEKQMLDYTHPKRDRKSELFKAILNRARAAGDLADIDPILDYCLPNKEEPEPPERDQYLTDYRFNILPILQFGSCEGISWRAALTRQTAPDCISVRSRRLAKIRRLVK